MKPPSKYNKWFAWALLFISIAVALSLFLLKLPNFENLPIDLGSEAEPNSIEQVALVGVEFSVQTQSGKNKEYKPIAELTEYYLAKGIAYFKLNQQGYVLIVATTSEDAEKYHVLEESLLVEENVWTPFPKESVSYSVLRELSVNSVCFLAFSTLQSLQNASERVRNGNERLPAQAGCLGIKID